MSKVADRILELEAQVLAASDAYFNGEAVMTDAQFDGIQAELKALDPSNSALAQIGAPVLGGSGRTKAKHGLPMGSLSKVQTAGEFASWTASAPGPYTIMEKMDGASLACRYFEGAFVEAVSRGDGVTGEIVTDNAVNMKFPKNLPHGFTGYIRGEVMITLTDFAAHFQGEKNPRNSAVGAMRRSNNPLAKHLTVFAYDVVWDKEARRSKSDELTWLRANGFRTPRWYEGDNTLYVQGIYDQYVQATRKSLDYEIDGLVIAINDSTERDALGESSGRPRGCTAFKFPHDSGTAVLNAVVWQVGKSGRICPVAEFTPVQLAGATVTRASLHNVAYIERLGGLSVGDTLMVSRRNDVIPACESVVTRNVKGSRVITPVHCPACSSQLIRVGEYTMCQNDACPAQVVGSMRRWVTKIGILHFGENLITAIADAGLATDPAELYYLNHNDVALLEPDGRRIGLTVATKAVKNLHAAKSMDLATFVGSLGIDLIGREMMRFFIDAGLDTLEKLWAASERTLGAIPMVGPTKAKALYDGLRANENLILRLIGAGVVILPPKTKVAATGSKMIGISVCMTGFRDAAMEAKILAEGGSIASGVSKNTGLLVCKDTSSGSGKTQKAAQLGVRVVDIAGAWAMLGGR